MCLHSEQEFNDHKQKWFISLTAERKAFITLIAVKDQIALDTNQIRQSVETALPATFYPLRNGIPTSWTSCSVSSRNPLTNPILG